MTYAKRQVNRLVVAPMAKSRDHAEGQAPRSLLEVRVAPFQRALHGMVLVIVKIRAILPGGLSLV